MAGILDDKRKLIDTILTNLGREALSKNDFQVEFVSFTDGDTFYMQSIGSGSKDTSGLPFLEATNNISDNITFTGNNDGINSFNGSILQTLGGKIITGSSNQIVSGTLFDEASSTLLSSSIENFKNLSIIGNDDPVYNDEVFEVSNDKIDFSLTNNDPFDEKEVKKINVNNSKIFLNDERFFTNPRFQYLPPINGGEVDENERVILSKYGNFDQKERNTENLFSNILSKQSRKISFLNQFSKNNIICQVFEKQDSKLSKLDIIEYGNVVIDDKEKSVYFVGKVFINDMNVQTFLNIFTIILG